MEPTPKLRVLIIDNSPGVTGALKAIAANAMALHERCHFTFIVPSERSAAFVRKHVTSDVVQLHMVELRRDFFAIAQYLPLLLINTFRLKRIVREKQIDIVHVNDLYNLLPAVARMFGMRQRYVCHIRFMPDRFPAWLFTMWVRLHARYSAALVAVSNAVAKQVKAHPKLIVLNDTVFPRVNFPVANASKENVFLYVANMIEGKGQQHALRAFASIAPQLPEWRLRFVGGDLGLEKNRQYTQRLRSLAKDLGVSEKTDWQQFTESVEEEYNTAAVALNFSDSESFSMTCLEALSLGTPVIATRCGGPSELIDHDVNGSLVAVGDVPAMAAEMLRLASDTFLQQRYAENGRRLVQARFNAGDTSDRLEHLYRNIAAL